MGKTTAETRLFQRRSFLIRSALAAAVSPFSALLARAAGDVDDVPGQPGTDYGPLVPVADEETGLPLLMLPRGFRYISMGWTGDRLLDGTLTPSSHDGMAALPGRDPNEGLVLLVRNHERSNDTGVFAPGRPV